jgi:hypothetical protein
MSQMSIDKRLTAELLEKPVIIKSPPDDRSRVKDDRVKLAEQQAQALRSTFTFVVQGPGRFLAMTPGYPGLQGVGPKRHIAADDLVSQLKIQLLWKSGAQPKP